LYFEKHYRNSLKYSPIHFTAFNTTADCGFARGNGSTLAKRKIDICPVADKSTPTINPGEPRRVRQKAGRLDAEWEENARAIQNVWQQTSARSAARSDTRLSHVRCDKWKQPMRTRRITESVLISEG
jgi:hypothetical protein